MSKILNLLIGVSALLVPLAFASPANATSCITFLKPKGAAIVEALVQEVMKYDHSEIREVFNDRMILENTFGKIMRDRDFRTENYQNHFYRILRTAANGWRLHEFIENFILTSFQSLKKLFGDPRMLELQNLDIEEQKLLAEYLRIQLSILQKEDQSTPVNIQSDMDQEIIKSAALALYRAHALKDNFQYLHGYEIFSGFDMAIINKINWNLPTSAMFLSFIEIIMSRPNHKRLFKQLATNLRSITRDSRTLELVDKLQKIQPKRSKLNPRIEPDFELIDESAKAQTLWAINYKLFKSSVQGFEAYDKIIEEFAQFTGNFSQGRNLYALPIINAPLPCQIQQFLYVLYERNELQKFLTWLSQRQSPRG